MDGVDRLKAWIVEREAIRVRRFYNEPLKKVEGRPVWTEDPILGQYRFCNVHREDDRVTRWIAIGWRQPNVGDPDLWFAMVVARFVNWPETLAEISYPVPWRRQWFLDVMSARKRRKAKLYTGAYMVRADREHADKAAYQEEVVFTPMWEARYRLRPKISDTLNGYHMLLGQFHGLGSFMAAQVVADLKYAPPLATVSDWETFAASGPGSRRGLSRVRGLLLDHSWTEESWRMELGRLRGEMKPWLEASDLELHAQDLQNCLCEFDKYERVRLGEGRPRARFP